jgi:hypothetical protein
MAAFDGVARAVDRLRDALRLPPLPVDEWIDCLRNAFPERWLERCRTPDRALRDDWYSRHPIDALTWPHRRATACDLAGVGTVPPLLRETSGIASVQTATTRW